MTMPALALVGASGRIQDSTESFRMRCGRAAELCEHLAELEGVLNGQADHAVARLDDVEARIEAVVDATGTRCALLTLVVDGRCPRRRERGSSASRWMTAPRSCG